MKHSSQIITKILLTEKGTTLSESQNQYFFRVARSANKLEIKRAVEELFQVKVTKVNTMVRTGKRKRERTQNYGFTTPWKRAVVTLKEGDTIDLT